MVCPCLLRGGKTRKARRSLKRGGYRRSRYTTLRSKGGYRATARNKALLRKYKSGKSIGFTAKASLKAKGLLPRSNGTYRLGPKYAKKRGQRGGSCGEGSCSAGTGGGAGLVFAN